MTIVEIQGEKPEYLLQKQKIDIPAKENEDETYLFEMEVLITRAENDIKFMIIFATNLKRLIICEFLTKERKVDYKYCESNFSEVL